MTASFEPYLDKSVVEQKHGCGKVPHPCPSKVKHLTYITNVSNFRMTETEFPILM